MKRALLLFLGFLGINPACMSLPPDRWTVVDQVLGLKGALQPDGVFKLSIPRADLNVMRGKVRVAPTLGLTSWIAFKDLGAGAVVVHGDLCLREEEVNPVMSRLQQGGIETTALHNHLGGEQPRVMFLHLWGRGEAKSLAETLRAVVDLGGGLQKPLEPLEPKLNREEIEKIMGRTARVAAGVLQFAVPRPFANRMHGIELPPSMGMATGRDPLVLESQPDMGGGSSPLIWESVYTAAPPQIDGHVDEVWRTAKPLTVIAREALGGGNPTPVVLRALHTNESVFVLAQWPDKTKSAMRDPYRWNVAKNTYERPSKPDDQFAIEFPIEGDFDVKMLSLTHRYVADVWHWKAGRGNPVGWVDDKRHLVGQQPMAGAAEYSLGGHGKVYIARPLDEGTPSYAVKTAPATFQGELVDSFEHREPTGSLADVRGKAVHDGKAWTLEMSRKFITGHADDAAIDPRRDNLCAIAVLDDELYWEHSVSPVIILRLIGGTYGEPGIVGQSPVASSSIVMGEASKIYRWSFEDAPPGAPPAWVRASRGRWEIQEVTDSPAGSKVLVQVAESPRPFFNLAVISGAKFRDLTVSVKFKALSGELDQGGGLVWRYQDPDNYYLARANPLENNFRLYRVVAGKRETLQSADVPLPAQVWHTLSITMRRNHILCELDGKKYLEAHDDTFKTVGLVGVWTKADANTAFDELMVESYNE